MSDISSLEESRVLDEKSRSRALNELNTSFFVEAGAGSGKTTLLVGRIINLIKSGVPVNEIAAITFTKAAAKEFKDRIVNKLGQLIAEIDKSQSMDEFLNYAKAYKVLTAQIKDNDLNGCFLGTIDSFCYQFLIDLDFSINIVNYHIDESIWLMIENTLEYNIFKDCYNRYLVEKCKRESIKCKSLKEVIESGNTIVFNNIVYDIDLGEPEYADLSLSDCKKKINENINVYLSLYGKYGKEFVFFNEYDKNQKSKLVNSEIELAKLSFHVYLKLLDVIKNIVLSKYNEEDMTFQQCLFKVKQILKEDICSGGDLIKEFSKRFNKKYYFLDEFQDTNPMQADIFYYLTHDFSIKDTIDNVDDCVPKPGSLFIVGDPKQSIYRFRGADISSYNKVKEHFISTNKCEVLYLTRNFRSNNVLLNFYNESFENMFSNDVEYFDIPLNDYETNNYVGISGVYKFAALAGNQFVHLNNDELEEFYVNSGKAKYSDIMVIAYSRKNCLSLLYSLGEEKAKLLIKNRYSDEDSVDVDDYPDEIVYSNDDDQKDKVSITTIHTSKGLEKPIVILSYSYPMIFSQDYYINNEKLVIKHITNGELFNKENIILHNHDIIPFSKRMKSLKNDYNWYSIDEIYNDNVNMYLEELNRLVYVAATRAGEALLICNSRTAGSEPYKSRWKKLLACDLPFYDPEVDELIMDIDINTEEE